MKDSNTKVDFIGIGAQKAGTTWLYQMLNNISDFDLPPVKEIHYFDRSKRYGKGFLNHTYLVRRLFKPVRMFRSIKTLYKLARKGSTQNFEWHLKWYFSNYTDRWYNSLFEGKKGLTGDITPNYAILDEVDIEHMFRLAPKAKIIFMLRNPIDRCLSHYRDIRSRKDPNFHKKALKDSDLIDFIHSPIQEERSDYFKILDKFQKFYPKDQIIIGFFDAIKEKPLMLLSDLIGHIGGNPKNLPDVSRLEKKINSSHKKAIPSSIQKALEEKYYFEIEQMAEVFGSYCVQWYSELKNDNISYKNCAPTLNLANLD